MFHGANALKRRINPTRVPIDKKESIRWLVNVRQSTTLLNDPGRCVHIGDRKSDIYELFGLAQEMDTHFLVRTCVERLAGDGGHTVRGEMEETAVRGLHRIKVRNKRGERSSTLLQIRDRRMLVRPAIGSRKNIQNRPDRDSRVGEGRPKGRERIGWKLCQHALRNDPLARK